MPSGQGCNPRPRLLVRRTIIRQPVVHGREIVVSIGWSQRGALFEDHQRMQVDPGNDDFDAVLDSAQRQDAILRLQGRFTYPRQPTDHFTERISLRDKNTPECSFLASLQLAPTPRGHPVPGDGDCGGAGDERTRQRSFATALSPAEGRRLSGGVYPFSTVQLSGCGGSSIR